MKLEIVSMILGGISAGIYIIGGLFSILFFPVYFSFKHPTALASKPVIWLASHTSKDVFGVVYIFIMLSLAMLLLYAISLCDFFRTRQARTIDTHSINVSDHS